MNRVVKINRVVQGNVQNYTQFLLNYLLPLIHWLYVEKNILRYESIYIEDPKIMRKHLKNIFPKKVKIYKEDYDSEINKSKTLTGFFSRDRPIRKSNYSLNSIRESTEELKSLLSNSQIDSKKILIINRGKPDKFYTSDGISSDTLPGGANSLFNSDGTPKRNRKGSSIERRSTPNLINIKNLLENYKFIELETESLENQIKLFGEHDIIIAQHGAALTNIIFCKKNSIIIEIRPRRDKKDSVSDSSRYEKQNAFEILSQSLGHKYFEVFQEHNHSEINLKDIVDLVKKNMGKL